MCSILSDILPSSNTLEGKNILWVYTYYYDLSPNTIADMCCKAVWNSGKMVPKYFDFAIKFRFVRMDRMKYRLTCVRTPVSPPPCNYILEFHCSINVFDQDSNVLVLESDKPEVFHIYDLDSCCIQLDDYGTALELKVMVKMIEYDIVSSPECVIKDEEVSRGRYQEEEFRKMKETYFNDEPVLDDLRYILHILEVQDIFTGRQTNEFAEWKSAYIRRTATFSRKIAEYIAAENGCMPLPSVDLGLILNYILNAVQKPINDEDLFKVYYEAHHMGLYFLVHLSRDAILDRIGDHSFMIKTLLAADRVDDKFLFERAAENFRRCDKTDRFNLEFQEQLESNGIKGRFMFRSLARQLRKTESTRPVETRKSWQSNFK